MLRELQNAAAVKRAARQRIADAAAHPGADTIELAEHGAAHDVATARWVSLLRAAAHDGHPIAVVARDAGVAGVAGVGVLPAGGRGASWLGCFVGGELLVQAVTQGPENELLYGNFPEHSRYPAAI